MNIFIGILIGIASVIALLLIMALLMKKEYTIQREIVINRPLATVFDYIKHIRNQDHYNKWVMADPNMKKEFKGTDATKGFIYAWEGNKKAGKGEQEITHIAEGERIDIEIRFIKPFPAKGYTYMSTEPAGNQQTNVKWVMNSKIPFPMNIMRASLTRMLGNDLQESLANLKTLLEK